MMLDMPLSRSGRIVDTTYFLTGWTVSINDETLSQQRREAVLAKLLPPYNMTIAELADQESISLATLYNWRKQAKSERRPVPSSKPTPDNCSLAVQVHKQHL